MGRFTSSDPLMASAKTGNPQTWNRYTYCLNNPLRYIDPSGLDAWDQLTSEEQSLVDSRIQHNQVDNWVKKGKGKKAHWVKDGKRTETGREAFNRLIGTGEGVNDRVLNVKNFLDSVGAHRNSTAWQEIKSIDGFWVSPGKDGNNDLQGLTVHVNNRDDFIAKLTKDKEYQANTWGDTVAGGHPNDSVRQVTQTSYIPGLHFANDDSNDTSKFFVHWDRRSSAFNERDWQRYGTVTAERIDAGLSHDNPYTPSQLRDQLRKNNLVPRGEP
jgi:hypothetical protein